MSTQDDASAAKICMRYTLALLDSGDIAVAYFQVVEDLLQEADKLGWPKSSRDGIPSVVLATIAPVIAGAVDDVSKLRSR